LAGWHATYFFGSLLLGLFRFEGGGIIFLQNLFITTAVRTINVTSEYIVAILKQKMEACELEHPMLYMHC
jgi:hypothetical protein